MKNQLNYFKECQTLNDVKSVFRQLAKKHHPDMVGGDTELFKVINNEYDEAFEHFQKLDNEKQRQENIKNNKAENYHFNYESSDVFRNIIETLIHFDIDIAIVGSWIWIDKKNTYPILNILHELKFIWSRPKKKWYWYHGIENQGKKYRSKYSYNQITEKYGEIKIETETQKMLA